MDANAKGTGFKDAKEICKQELGKGNLTGDEPWVIDSRLVTKEATEFLLENGKKSSTRLVSVSNDELFLEDQFADGSTCITRDKDGEILSLTKFHRGTGLDSCYIYATRPAFENQEPADEKLPAKDGGDDDGDTTTQFYMFARVLGVKEFATRVVKLSYCKGVDTDNESGFAWKDIYKAIKRPHFSYACSVLDMDGNVVAKSRQKRACDVRPTFEVAPGADLFLLTACCLFHHAGRNHGNCYD